MSPEQARGTRELSPASDVFSLGCVAFECLTGRTPFHGEHVASVLVKILFESPQSISTLRTDVPDGLIRVVMAMLEKEPKKRPPDAMSLLPELREIQLSAVDAVAPTLAYNPSTMGFDSEEQRLVSMVVAAAPFETQLGKEDTHRRQFRVQYLPLSNRNGGSAL